METKISKLDALFDTFLAVQARINSNLEVHAAALGLNGTQLLVIRDVNDHPGTTLTDVCQRCGLKKSAASRLVDALAERGLLVRKVCPTSRRAVALSLGPVLGDGQFCRVTALNSTLAGWQEKAEPSDIQAAMTGLETLLRLTEARS